MARLPPIPYDKPATSFEWIDWYTKLKKFLEASDINHNDLKNIQGGTSTERYHLTAAQQNLVSNWSHNALNDLQGGTSGQYYHLTQAEHTALTTNLEDTVENIVAKAYAYQYDQNADPPDYAYIGQADPGSSTASAVWRIAKITFEPSDGDFRTKWADGDSNFNNVWDNRASLSYS